MGSLNRTGVASGYANLVSTGGSSTITATATTSSSLTVAIGDVIVAALGGTYSGVSGGTNAPVVTDTLGNSYTQAVWTAAAHQTGGTIGFFVSIVTHPGTGTVSGAISCQAAFGSALDAGITAASYSGFVSPLIQATALTHTFGSAGNAPQVLNITDAFGVSVAVTYSGPSGSGGVGSDSAIALLNLTSGATHYLFGCCRTFANSGVNVPTATPGGYQTFVQAAQALRADTNDSLYFWDATPPPVTIDQPQIFVVT